MTTSITDFRQPFGIGIDLSTQNLHYQSLTSEHIFKVGVGINYFDDTKGLIKILTNDTVYDYITKFYVIDGLYAGRNDKQESDPTYLKDLQNIYSKIHIVDMNNKTQIQKRNKYWELAKKDKMDYMIVCDSDEYMDIKPAILDNSLRTIQDRPEKCYPIKQHMVGITTMSRPRLFKGPYTFRHLQNKKENMISHGSLYDKDDTEIINQMYAWFKDHPKREINSDNQSGIDGIEMWHNKEFRTKERIIADRVYYDNTPNR